MPLAPPSHRDEPDPGGGERARRVEQVLRRLSGLPTLPAVATRLLELSADEAGDSAEVIRLIESDPAMSVAVLRLLQRLDRATASKATSVERAVLSVGFRQVRDAALAIGVLTALPAPTGPDAAGLELGGFWTHGIAVGVAAERLAAAAPGCGVVPRDAFLPGMLHDVGKLALQVALPEAYARVVQAARRHQLPMAEAEVRVLGLDHQTAGRRIARRWGLPEPLTDCIWLHGTSPLAMPESPHAPLVHLVTAADALARVRHLGESGSHHPVSAPTATLEALGLEPAAADAALGGLEAEVAGRAGALGIPGGGEDPVPLYAAAVGRAHADLVVANRRLADAAAAAEEQRRTLGLVDAFLARSAAARPAGLVATAGAVASSAGAAAGASRCLVVVPAQAAGVGPDAAEAGGWHVTEAGARPPRHVGPEDAAGPGAPGPDAWPLTPAQLAAVLGEPAVAGFAPLGVREPAAAGAPLGVVFTDAAAAAPPPPPPPTLVAAWAAALRSAAERDRHELLGERLAAANRRLEATRDALVGRAADARLREIAAGAAHEMNNPLAVLTGRTEQLALRLDGDALPLVKAAAQATQRLGELVAALGMFSRPPSARRRPSHAAEIAGEAVEAVRASRPLRREQMEPLEVSLRAGAGLGSVDVDPDMVRRCLDELVTNALQAHPAGFVAVRVWLEEADAGGAPAVVLEVSDDGDGMDERTLRHAADPFFSRQAAGRRAGLGLARVTLWAAAHGGDLSLRHRPGGGCVARVRLPQG